MGITIAEAQANPEEYLGRDILMGNDGRLVFSSSNDFAVVRFSDNLRQAIITRLNTAFGEYNRHPLYGSDLRTFFGESYTIETANRIKIAVRESLFQEPRIESILSIDVALNDANPSESRINVGITVQPIMGLDVLNLIYELFI